MTKLRVAPGLALPIEWMMAATVLYGARGSGKTTLGAVLIEEVTKAGQRFCAIDVKGDYWGLKASADGKSEGIPVVVFGGDHADLPLDPLQGELMGELVAGLEQSTVIDLEHVRKGQQLTFLASFFERLYEKNRAPLLLVLDEAQRYASQAPDSKEGHRCLGAVEDLVKLGRKHGIGPLVITQRGAGLNKEVSELCDMLIACRTPGVLDQARIKGWFEANAKKEARDEVLDQLSELETGTAVFASAHPKIKVFKTVKVRRRETFDSSATPEVGKRQVVPKQLAKPDLDALRERLTATIQQQKENDPVELKKKIAELQGQLQQLSTAAEKESRQVITKRVEVPAIKKGEIERLERVAEKLDGAAKRALDGAQKSIEALTEVVSRVAGEYEVMRATLRRVDAPRELQLGPPVLEAARRAPANGHVKRPMPPAPRPRAEPGDMPVGEAAILDAVIQWDGLQRAQLTTITGYKRSTRDAYIKRLVTKGYLEAGSEAVRVTPEGRAARPNAAALPRGEALQSYWLQRLPVGERAILERLLAAHPGAVARDALTDQTGYKRSTRDAYIKRMAAKELVVDLGGGQVRANNTLFE